MRPIKGKILRFREEEQGKARQGEDGEANRDKTVKPKKYEHSDAGGVENYDAQQGQIRRP